MRTAWNKITFTKEMDQFLIDNHSKMNNQQLANSLGLKLTRTRTRLYELGLKRMELEYWTQEQVDYLKANYKEIGDTELAEIFDSKWQKNKGWSKKHIEKKRRYLKLKRTIFERRQIKKRNIENGRFADCSKNAWITRGIFPEGTIRVWSVSSYKCKMIKINGEYVYLSRHIWKQHNGEIPEGHNIIYKDGNQLNCVIENLMMVDDAELAIRNKNKELPDQLIETKVIISKINKQLKTL